ncbi:MAG: glycosyltransferase family 4 protein [Desulfovibrio sp.]|uniref:glycosyltransferase family 4 protein n=1 Tax=Desulfovibrio sp. TaxID=885 RepID=UPI00258B65D2|nr:glycosyltransferase family 4 protein [Desulfovibrio sp.]MCD7985167.1 glycosyltransferase family 4 protein [Desulfovibrio sp.]
MDNVLGAPAKRQGPKVNIALVTREVSDLTNSGGIGTAVRSLCEYLALRGGHTVSIYYTGRPSLAIPGFARQTRRRGIAFHCIISLSGLLLRKQSGRIRRAHAVLTERQHDVYLFHDFMADGFFCIQAKRRGEAFTESLLGVVAHGSSLWVDEGNGRVADGGERKRVYAMERACCEQADFLVSPSRYLVGWMRAHGWRLPEETRCIPNITSMPDGAPPMRASSRLDSEALHELVFFGRLEERKGIRIFCDALLSLPPDLLAGRRVTFLGKEAGFRAGVVRAALGPLAQRGVSLSFLTGLNAPAARRYLCGDGIVAIMPSLRENSPCVVAECLESRIPFLATSVGGSRELVREEDRAFAFVDPDASRLAERLREVLGGGGLRVARPAHAKETLFAQWQSLLQTRAHAEGSMGEQRFVKKVFGL